MYLFATLANQPLKNLICLKWLGEEEWKSE